MDGSSLRKRIKRLEEKTGGENFHQRMEKIFATESYDELTSSDVDALKIFMPDKYKFLISEVCKVMQENI